MICCPMKILPTVLSGFGLLFLTGITVADRDAAHAELSKGEVAHTPLGSLGRVDGVPLLVSGAMTENNGLSLGTKLSNGHWQLTLTDTLSCGLMDNANTHHLKVKLNGSTVCEYLVTFTCKKCTP